jgi:glucose/arabinose dehydrogenase
MTYVSATGEGDNGQPLTSTTLARARLDGHALTDLEVLFQDSDPAPPGVHYGSRLAWLPDGTLLMSIGDRGFNPPRAQDLGDYAGTLLRLNADGSVPADNPFVDHEGAKPEIYAYGLRNIQGLWVDANTGDIWASDHGPRGGDELNLIVAGRNYGWPAVTLGRDYRTQAQFGDSVRSKPGVIDPVVDWTPSIAPSGLTRVSGEHWPRWDGNIISGGLRSEQLRRVVLEDGAAVHEEALIPGLLGRIRDVRSGADGSLWVLTDHADGGVYRITPAG